MMQVPLETWNRVAQEQTLRTAWARRTFPLPPTKLEEALGLQEQELAKREGGSLMLAAAFLRVAPLLWEAEAISRFLGDHPDLADALLPTLESPNEAVAVASRDFPLSATQQRILSSWLRTAPN